MEMIITSAIVGALGGFASSWIKSILDHKSYKSKVYHDKMVSIMNELYGKLEELVKKTQYLDLPFNKDSFKNYGFLYEDVKSFYSKNLLYIDNKSKKSIDEILNIGNEINFQNLSLEFHKYIEKPSDQLQKEQIELEIIIKDAYQKSFILLEKVRTNFSKEIK